MIRFEREGKKKRRKKDERESSFLFDFFSGYFIERQSKGSYENCEGRKIDREKERERE